MTTSSDRRWVRALTAALLLVVLAAILTGWTIPLIIGAFSFGWMAVVLLAWMVVVAGAVLFMSIGGQCDRDLERMRERS